MSRLLEHLRDEFIHAADPVKAPSMQRYMKSAMPYHGVPSTGMKAICRNVFTGLAFERSSEWEQAVIEIWEGAQFREERYAALILAGHRSAQRFQTPEALPLYERLIVAGAWWDIVDDVAIHRVGPLVRTHLSAMKSAMLDWATDANLWKRRASIICQVGSKKETDLDLLYACIEPSVSSKDFWLRKAIGWALREYSRTDPAEVARYVQSRASDLSGLSTREALRHVPDHLLD